MTLAIPQLISIILLIFISINQKKVPFNIDKPQIKIELSKELKEISGLSWYNNQLAAVQDEAGILYLLDASSGIINEKIKFTLPGDFEGIEAVDNTFYTLTSSGTLFSFDKNTPQQTKRIDTPLTWRNDAEGLAFDSLNNQLLIICKESGSVANYQTKAKSIYALNLPDYKFSKQPVTTIKKSEMKKFAKVDKFKPSALAIDPLTQDLYVLASSGNLLVVLDHSYQIKTVVKLPANIYAQPEGICFSPNGDLYISNEGNDDKPNFYHLFRSSL